MVEAKARKWAGSGVSLAVCSAQVAQMEALASAGPPRTRAWMSGALAVAQRGHVMGVV